MDTRNELVTEYLKVVDLRAKVFDGTANEEQREEYFYNLRYAVLSIATAAASAAILHRIPVTSEVGRDLMACIEGTIAIALGEPGPILEDNLNGRTS